MTRPLIIAMLPILLAFAGAASAQEQVPGYLKPEVLAAAAAMNLTEEQQSQFRSTLGTFLDDRMKAINTLMRKNNQRGIDRKIRSRTNSLLKKMDKSMAEFLTEDQMPAYENYRKTLKANLWGM